MYKIRWGLLMPCLGLASLCMQSTAQEVEQARGEEAFLPYKSRIQSFCFDRETFPAKYLGVQSFHEKSLGKINASVRGIAVARDGAIALSIGNGTTSSMKLISWKPDGTETEIIPLTYQKFDKETTEKERQRLEENGILWFFAGQCAYDRDENLHITFGACSGNGIYRVFTSGPTKLKRINHSGATSSFQIPPWDTQNGYVGWGYAIWKIPLKPHRDQVQGKGVFSMNSEKVLLGPLVMLDESNIIATICPLEEKDGQASSGNYFVIHIDKANAGYWLLADYYFGPLALTADGHAFLRYDQKNSQLCEVTLGP